MRTLPLLVVLLGGITPARADQLDDARTALVEDRCADALTAVARARGWSTERFVVEGDAHRCAGDLGRATLAYLRAARLDPSDPEVAERLDAVTLAAGLAPADDGVVDLVRRVRLEVWSWSAALLASLACVLFAVGVLWTRRYRLATALSVLTLAVGALAHVAALPLSDAVVVAPDAIARVSPAPTAPAAFDLRPGVVLSPRARRDGFVQVEVAGQLGWVPAAALASVAPDGPT